VILYDPFLTTILLVLGKYTSNDGSSKWSLPKGESYAWETAEQCALRELAEETGFNLSFRYLKQHGWPHRMHKNTYFVVFVDSTKIRIAPRDTTEIARAEFIPLSHLIHLHCNSDLRRWRDSDFPNLLPRQNSIVSIWGCSPWRYKVSILPAV
jgi:ADP-ribose pyrophosphatase YjhB (NUDIX family)